MSATARFYHEAILSVGEIVTLSAAVVQHVKALRYTTGASLQLFNGQGGVFYGQLLSLAKNDARVKIDAFAPEEVELPYAICLAQALPEGAKMDGIIQKAVELGASSIQPLSAQRCVFRIRDATQFAKKYARWENIVQSAAAQCLRNRLTQILPVMTFSDWISADNHRTKIMISPRAKISLAQWARATAPQSIALAIGPEGGFSLEEETQAKKNAVLLSMGPRILRTETAGLAALAMVQAHWEAPCTDDRLCM